ncbi:MAG: ABC transporter permease [Candidatus Omnitrophica bacterium]|nr:ABC transporter permease [Candidatus Omnitrophota bacterium]
MACNLINKKITKQLILYFILLALWQILVSLKIWPQYLLPSPAKVCATLAEGFKNHTFLIGIMISFKRLLIGFGISIFCGAALGVFLLKYKIIDEALSGLILGLQTLPSICWFPLAIIWFNLSEWAIIFVIIAGSLFSITMATSTAFKNVPPIYIKAGRNMGARGVTLLRKVIIPAAIPSLLIGLRQSWSFAWRSLMAGELLFNSLGLGYLLYMGRELNDMSMVLAVMLVIAAISITIDRWIFGELEAKIRLKYGL